MFFLNFPGVDFDVCCHVNDLCIVCVYNVLLCEKNIAAVITLAKQFLLAKIPKLSSEKMRATSYHVHVHVHVVWGKVIYNL